MYSKLLYERAAVISGNGAKLLTRLLSARDVLHPNFKPAFKEYTFLWERQCLISQDGKLRLQWENTGESSIGEVSVLVNED